MKKLTIGIGTYGNEHCYIKPTLDSLICLLKKYNFMNETQIIITNDDSSYSSSYIVALTYIKKYPDLIKCQDNKQNLGIAKTYQKMLQQCDTDYFMIFDSDDIVNDFNIVEQIDFLDNNQQYCGSYGQKLCFNENGETTMLYGSFYSLCDFDINMNNNSMIIRTKDALHTGFYFPQFIKNTTLKMYTDIAMWIGLLTYKPFYFDYQVRTFGRIHNNSFTQKNEKENVDSYFKLFEAIKNYVFSHQSINNQWQQLKYCIIRDNLSINEKDHFFFHFQQEIYFSYPLFKSYLLHLKDYKKIDQIHQACLNGLIINRQLYPFIYQFVMYNNDFFQKNIFLKKIAQQYSIQKNEYLNSIRNWFLMFFC